MLDHKTVSGYIHMMPETSLTHALGLDKAGKAGLRAPGRILLENANLYHAVAKESGFTPNEGGLRETFSVNAMKGTGAKVRYSRSGARNACLVKDGQLAAAPGEIPLYLFGFLW